MSNPIADTADFFAQRSSQGRRPDGARLGLSVSGSTREDPDRLLSPESPTTRQRHHSYPQQDEHHFDPRIQWQRVLNKLSFLGPEGSQPSLRRLHGDDSDEDLHSDEHEMHDLHDPWPRSSSIVNVSEQDDALPAPEELQAEPPEPSETKQNYFIRPFTQTMPSPEHADRSETSSNEPSPSPQASGRARHRWGKTLDKIRLIANLHVPHTQEVTTGAQSLAPYYAPVFDPLFLAFSKDEYGRRMPPILLQCLSVDVTDSEPSSHGINQWIFRIELQYGDVKWVIRKTIADFVALHYTLKIKSNLSAYVPAPPTFPSQLQNWISSAKTTMRMDRDDERETEKEKKELALNRRNALTLYLRKLLQRAHYIVNYDICEFLEISAISIVQDMGWKGKEGYLENRVNFVTPRICHNIIRPHLWTKEWVILRDSYIAFCADIASQSPTDVLLLDKSFTVTNRTPGLLGRYHHHIILANRFRRIEIKGSKRQVEEWMESIKRVQQESPWVRNHRFGSFSPIRSNAKVKWFVDAEDHFNAVAEAILSAKSDIYIADWWLSPELYLRRPPEKNQAFRLDRLLQRKAQEGVMIYIVVYKEMAVALTIDSAHTKRWLQSLHPNIVVQRHPDHRSIDNNVLFWSHHEKMVVVDNRLAFIGGLDLCWGRYDTHAHSLSDYPAAGHEYEVFPGQDYSNPRVKDFLNVVQHETTLVDRRITPRMPWHDVTIGVVGPIARDIARHFIQRWNFLKASKARHRPTVPFLTPKGEYVAARDESKFTGTCRVQLLRSSAQWSSGIEREHSIYNAYMECITKAKHFIYIENQFFISATTQDKILRNKIGQAMVERIKLAHKNGEKFKIFIMIPLIPAFEGDLASSDASAARNVMHFQYLSISRGGNSIIEKLKEAGIEPSDYIGWYCLRNWGKIDPCKKENSPTKKKVERDSGALFRENANSCDSSTVSQTDSDTSKSNTASEKSMSGSKRKKEKEDNGKEDSEQEEDDRNHYVSELVYIHDKLMIVDDKIVLIGSANINDRSQLGNRDSEVAMLIEDTELVPSYMNGKQYKAAKFAHSLRMQLWREHLGLLNFDNWPALMKESLSGNIATCNSDSGMESHSVTESEVQSIEAKDPDRVLDQASRSEAHEASVGESNISAAQALDPLTDHCYQNIWRKTAATNTRIYRQLFRCVPDDTVHTFEQHRQFVPERIPHGHVADPSLSSRDIRKTLLAVRGHLVEFPTEYLKEENMLGSYIRETVTPMVIFT
ncbi:Phospholipase D1 [Apophysomyces ossiformis]|uniref:Phospholipase n=1 Tax=Apophysomyces ossiformis TaxID=679940 RepID=A0A8H7BJW9_9FUNG|nr:Phospholipase D1 [Apophysomyces ossiformis]